MKFYINAEDVYDHLVQYTMFSKYWPEAKQQVVRIKFILKKYDELLELAKDLDVDSEPEKSEFNFYKLVSMKFLKKTDEFNALMDKIEITDIENDFQYKILKLTAEELENQKRYKEAVDVSKELLDSEKAKADDQMELIVKIGNLYYMMDELEMALQYFNIAEEEKVNLEYVLFQKGKIFQDLRRLREAQVILTKLRKMNPNSFWVKQLEKYVR